MYSFTIKELFLALDAYFAPPFIVRIILWIRPGFIQAISACALSTKAAIPELLHACDLVLAAITLEWRAYLFGLFLNFCLLFFSGDVCVFACKPKDYII